MYNSILIPTDGSEHAGRAAEHALVLADAFDATVHVITVVDPLAEAGPFARPSEVGSTTATTTFCYRLTGVRRRPPPSTTDSLSRRRREHASTPSTWSTSAARPAPPGRRDC